jgi:hypothetical protein
MTVPDARTLLSRKRYGREEYVQDILAALIVGADPPRWNVAATSTLRGAAFFTDLVNLATSGWVTTEASFEFVNEFELQRRDEAEVSGWPDFAGVWSDSLALVELKTEPSSHRVG